MKRKLFIILTVLVGITMQCMAQKEFITPKFTKAFKVLSNSVNIRQEPSIQSKVIGKGPDILLVIEETEEWYHACILKDGVTLSQPGYVSKKVCKVKELSALDATYIKNAWSDAMLSLKVRQSGKYKGYNIITYYDYYRDRGRTWVFVGKNMGSVCVGKMLFYLDDSFDDAEYTLSSPEGSDNVKVSKKRMNDKEGDPDWSKLTDDEISRILSNGAAVIMVAGIQEHTYRDGTSESGKGVETYSFDESDYQGPILQ